MPSISKKQKHFFQAVKHAKNDPNYGDARLRKVADSMGEKDIDDFANRLAELKTKKALLGILKDIVEPMYLEESDEGETGATSVDPVTKTFHISVQWDKYVKSFVGQPLSPKETEAVHNLKEKEPTTINRTEIWYNTSDDMNGNKTTVIKKMKDGGQFSWNAFQKQESLAKDSAQQGQNEPMASSLMEFGENPLPPMNQTPPGNTTPEPGQDQQDQQNQKDDVIVTKSILFKDEIRGAGILISFLKELDL
jgi:hypothetical protein